ncbi:glycosyltransferase [Bradyrhizobium sp. 62B]|uniref:glycosyltransferase n=2 Tax=Pseudomonadota TaxID=1224 RepID=UPI0025580F26|nr:glycosyltransferase [Bradyrhizobium sp. 62B]
MRILRVIASVNPRDGGPVEGLRSSAEMHQLRGHETEVVSLDDPDADYLKDFPFPVFGQGPRTRVYGYTPRLVPWLKLNCGRFDAAVFHGLWNFSSVGAWLGVRHKNLPYVVFPHGMLDPWFRSTYPLKHMAKQALWSLAQGRVMRDAKNVLFTSAEEQLLAKGVFRGFRYPSQVVKYGSKDLGVGAPHDRHAFLRRFPQIRGARYLLFLSRIHPKKGIDLLIRAFAAKSKLLPDCALVIAGPDQVCLQAELQRLADDLGVSDRVVWPGMLQGQAKIDAYRGAAAFVLPSHQENFGIVVAEAMSCGTPVLTTTKVNTWREVVSCGAGLVEPDTPEGIERLVEAFARLTPDQEQDMRLSARIGFERQFAMQAAADDLLRVLQNAATVPEEA